MPVHSPSIGLAGTVGSGKSLAVEILRELGAVAIWADRIGHALLLEAEVQADVTALLGDSVLAPGGGLDRKRIGEVVFSAPARREGYDKIIHPRLLARLRENLEALADEQRVVVVEAALIPEWGIEDWFDEVWCIRCSDARALARWKRDPELYWKIRKAQFAPERKSAKATRVIENERSQEEFRRRIEIEFEQFQRGHGG
ncbi:MAG: dephospho-CoA kinase [Candidatus Omnitrophica bacterium]|nr:dephospho-CoA kinase [Candidatus Omnitrophota bacterium]